MRLTPLAAEHRAAGAKMVAFAGWEMPLHYGSQLDEHHAVRRSAGVFDVSHMLALDIEGDAAFSFLRSALANDVARLHAPGMALYSCLLAADGGILDDLIVYFLAPQRYRVVVNAATAATDCAWLEALRPAGAALVPRRDLALLAVQGPAARERCQAALPELQAAMESLQAFRGAAAGAAFVARTGYTGEDGYELMLPAGEAARVWERLLAGGVQPCGLGARDTLRLEAGLNLYGYDMDQTVTPYECGLGWTVDRAGTREFMGRDALARRTPEWTQLGLVLRGGGVLRDGQQVATACGNGVVTSGTYAPTMQASIGLARLPRPCEPGSAAAVTVRGRRLPVALVRPPFVRKGRILV